MRGSAVRESVSLRTRSLIALVTVALVAAACSGGDTEAEPTVLMPSSQESSEAPGDAGPASTTAPAESYAGSEPAPEFPDGLDWLNSARPLSLSELRGKVVLLDFWTYGCINCIHVIPDLKRLEEEYAEELVVIGVHSAKFENEAETENIRQIIVRYDLEHPVVNDAEFAVWRQWGASAWPTLVLIDPAGHVVGGHAGEGIYRIFEPVIRSLVAEFDTRGELDRTPLDLSSEKDAVPNTLLSFPGKVLADPSGERLFIADTNHHRIVVADPTTGEVLDVAGTGTAGFRNGPFTDARFDQPQGMALSEDGTVLYVADVGNHSIRALDFLTRSVTLIAGEGRQALAYPPVAGVAPDVSLSSPWALERSGTTLYIAMAGSHQIWLHDLESGLTTPVAGSGREGAVDGPTPDAQLAQPSGLAIDEAEQLLYFADSESSTIRVVDLENQVTALVSGSGDGLFDFGDVDGIRSEARLQHPLGVAFDGEALLIADTYNSKIKRIDPATGATETYLGDQEGWRDGPEALFYEPGGVDVLGRTLYIADTNNHSIRTVDLDTGETSTLVLYGIERFVGADDTYTGTIVELDPVTVAAGPGRVVVDVDLPDGYKVNDIAPFSMVWTVDGDVAELTDADQSMVAPAFPLEVEAEFSAGTGSLLTDLTVYYCTAESEELCLIERVRIIAPLEVGEGPADVVLSYMIPPPPLLDS